MSDASGDTLYRSDNRSAPNGAQQADLAPVSDQPEEHWSQQAEARGAETPPAPSAPTGAPPPEDDGRSPPQDGPRAEAPQAEPSLSSGAQPDAPAQPVSDPASPGDDTTAVREADRAVSADLGHSGAVTLGGDITWSDSSGQHQRSGELTVDLDHATTVGGGSSASWMLETLGHNLPVTDAPDFLNRIQDEVSGTLDAANGAIGSAATALGVAEMAASTATATGALLDDGLSELGQTLGALDPPPVNDALAGAVGPLSTAIADPLTDALGSTGPLGGLTEDGGGLAPQASGSSGLLASLFQPEASDGAPTAPLSEAAALGHELGLGDLLGSADPHSDLGHDLPDF